MPTQFQTHLWADKKVLIFYMGHAHKILYKPACHLLCLISDYSCSGQLICFPKVQLSCSVKSKPTPAKDHSREISEHFQ